MSHDRTEKCYIYRENSRVGFAAAAFDGAFDPPTSCFHFFTSSFASSATSFDAFDLSLPTAKPILLS